MTNKEYHRAYRKSNPDKTRAISKKYCQTHKEQKKAYAKANPDKGRAAVKKYYYKNREKRLSQMKKTNEAKTEFRNNVKLHYGCMHQDCKWIGPIPSYCLDFHHLSEKKFNIGCTSRAISTIIVEINKCIILCATCHRMATWGELDCSTFSRCALDNQGNFI